MAGCVARLFIRSLRPARLLLASSINFNRIEILKYSYVPLNRPSKYFSTTPISEPNTISPAIYEKVCKETLDSLFEYIEEVVDQSENLKSAEVSYGDGVLTINLGSKYGTYVINRQLPNKQIWLSSPKSGPKRYDFVTGSSPNEGEWIYKHTGESLHYLLQKELVEILKSDLNLLELPYSKLSSK